MSDWDKIANEGLVTAGAITQELGASPVYGLLFAGILNGGSKTGYSPNMLNLTASLNDTVDARVGAVAPHQPAIHHTATVGQDAKRGAAPRPFGSSPGGPVFT